MDKDVRSAIERASKLCEDECDEDAERVMLDALETHPKNLDLRTMLGKIQSRLHREDDAEITLRGVLEEDPFHEDATCALGRLLDQSLRTEEAESVFRELLQKAPDSHCALDDLCRLLHSEGKHLEALEFARGHVKRFPSHIDAYDGLRYILAVIEDDLCGGYISESTSNEVVEQLVENLLEQYDAIVGIEEHVGQLENLPESVSCDLKEEYLRIVGELEHLSEIIKGRAMAIPSSLTSQLLNSVQEGSSRRAKM